MGCVVFSLFLGCEKNASMTPAPEAWRVPLRSQRTTRVAEPGCAPGQCLQLWGSNAIPLYIYNNSIHSSVGVNNSNNMSNI